MDKYMTAPFAKVKKTDDGGREIWGYSTIERKDKAGEIADFDGTIKAFEKWSNDTSQRTDGKSLGNVRVMHQPIAAGKMIHYEPSETTIKDDDGKEQIAKAIWVGAYVPPTKVDVIRDIDEGILSAFSIGGSYAKKWWDSTAKAFRFIPELAEFSLVDNPCVEGADIINIINKAHKPWENDNRNLEKRGVNVADQELIKKAKLAGSYEELQNNIQTAVAQKFKGFASYWDGYVVSTMPDKVVVFDYNTRKYLEVPYTNTDGVITVGDAVTEVQEVTNYIPVAVQKFIDGELQKRAQFKEAEDKNTTQKEAEKSMDKEEMKKAALESGISEEQFENYYKTVNKAVIPIDDERAIKDKAKKDPAEKVKTKKVEEKPKQEPKDEEIEKACKALGVSVEMFKAIKSIVNKSADPSQSPAPVDCTTLDGTAGTFGSDGPVIDIGGGQDDVVAAEKATYKAVLSDLKKGIETLETEINSVNKANVAISKGRLNNLTHAKNHIDAAINGTTYGPEQHVEVEGGTGGKGNTGEESPEATVKVLYGDLQKGIDGANTKLEKAFNDSLLKTENKIEALFKGIATAESLTKTAEDLTKMYADLKETAKLVKEIHETPIRNNVVLNGGNPLLKTMENGHFNLQSTEESVLEKVLNETKDPMVKDRLGQELAMRKMKQNMNSQGGK